MAIALALAGCVVNTEGNTPTDPLDSAEHEQALIIPPSCVRKIYDGHTYLFCDGLNDWASARSYCQNQGMELARIDSSTEGNFVQANLAGNSWLGASDASSEGTWTWNAGGQAFYAGGFARRAFFTDFEPGEPNNLLDEDCLVVNKGGGWNDSLCGAAGDFVCESVSDRCPDDPRKTQPGMCDCGTMEIDTDGDGTPDCRDLCPLDDTHVSPGDCGCPSDPEPSGTLCNDGLCAANNVCDGAGSCGSVQECAPSSNCTEHAFGGKTYFFCRDLVTFDLARRMCRRVSLDLVAIESQAEDDFIGSHASGNGDWIGNRESGTSGTWSWINTQQVLFSGGQAASGVYANWALGTPEYPSSGSCGSKNPVLSGRWDAIACGSSRGYVCEEPGFRLDPTLNTPGTKTPDPSDGVQDPVSVVKLGDETIPFVANQLVLETSDANVLADFNARYGGTVVETIDFPAEPEDDLQNIHGIRLDPARMAYPGSLEVDLGAVEPELAGLDVYFSDLLGARLFATWLEARSLGFEVDIDLLEDGEPSSASTPCYYESRLLHGNTLDGPQSGNVFNQAELSLTRVPEAWQKLALAGRYVKSVRMASVDRGFVNAAVEHDYDGFPSCARSANCMRGNQVDAEAYWKWHGANVSYVLMGEADNERGAAGVAGRLVDVEQWEDPGRYRARLRTWRRVMRDEYDIMTTSVALGGKARKRLRIRYNRVIRRVGRKGLLFAAAGNDGISGFVECDFKNVQCVGGLRSDGSGIHPDSNHSHRVDFWTPYTFIMPDIAPNGDPTNNVVPAEGTSYSTPHAAAIAALAMAANPTWRQRDGASDRKLKHRGKILEVLKSCNQSNRAMDAACVVRKALEAANAPPAACILDPVLGGYYEYDQVLNAQAAVSDWGAPQTAAWSIDGVPVGSGDFLSTFIPGVGAQQLTLDHGSASDSVEVTRLEPDEIKVTDPPSGACIREDDAQSGVKLRAIDMFRQAGAPAPQFDWAFNGSALGTGNGITRALTNATAGNSYQISAEIDDGVGDPERGTSVVRIVSDDVAEVTLAIRGMSPREDLARQVRAVTANVTVAAGDTLPAYDIVWLLRPSAGDGEIYLGSGASWALDGAMLGELGLAAPSWHLVAKLVAQVEGFSCALAWTNLDVTQPSIIE